MTTRMMVSLSFWFIWSSQLFLCSLIQKNFKISKYIAKGIVKKETVKQAIISISILFINQSFFIVIIGGIGVRIKFISKGIKRKKPIDVVVKNTSFNISINLIVNFRFVSFDNFYFLDQSI